ncbi:MAG TPA: DUF4288 domain-containing protein [Roseiarcus sp.]|nr:DUF4288 domain-containing protein [Roseiarcus sp.]
MVGDAIGLPLELIVDGTNEELSLSVARRSRGCLRPAWRLSRAMGDSGRGTVPEGGGNPLKQRLIADVPLAFERRLDEAALQALRACRAAICRCADRLLRRRARKRQCDGVGAAIADRRSRIGEHRAQGRVEDLRRRSASVLITAESLDEANQKALSLAEEDAVSYLNERGETIVWSLKQIVDVNQVLAERLEDGAELYAKHFRDCDGYRRFEELAYDHKQSNAEYDGSEES